MKLHQQFHQRCASTLAFQLLTIGKRVRSCQGLVDQNMSDSHSCNSIVWLAGLICILRREFGGLIPPHRKFETDGIRFDTGRLLNIPAPGRTMATRETMCTFIQSRTTWSKN
jgi:hypothetical protein